MLTPENVLNSVMYYIPSDNILDEEQMLEIAATLIAKYGDDDKLLGMISCELLKAIGNINKTMSIVEANGVRRERLGKHEIEKFSVTFNPWDKYLEGLSNYICPVIFGVPQKIVIGATYHSDKHPTPVVKCKN